MDTGEGPTLILPACAGRTTGMDGSGARNGVFSRPATQKLAETRAARRASGCHHPTWNFQEKEQMKTMHELS